MDAELIFNERTAQLPVERPTMERLGEKIGRLAVTVKRTETESLERLASAILGSWAGYAQCVFRPDWLEMWKDLKFVFDRYPGDQKTFRRSIEGFYDFDERELTMAMPTI